MVDKPKSRKIPLQILAYLFAGLVILSLPIGVFANQTQRAITSPEVVGEVLSEALFSAGSGRDFLTSALLSSDRFETAQTLLFEHLNQNQRDEIMEILIPDGWIENQLQTAVVEFLTWIESERERPNFVLDLAPFKEGLGGGGAKRILEIVFDALPTCTPLQLNELRAALLNDNLPTTVICVPRGDLALQLRGLMEREILLQIREIPSQLKLSDELGEIQDLENIKKGIVSLLEIMRRIRLIPILFFGLLMTVAIRSLIELGRWWGIPLILGSIFGLLLALLMLVFAPAVLEQTIASADVPNVVFEGLQRGLISITNRILKAATFQNIVAIVAGVLLFGLTRIRGQQPKPEVPQESVRPDREDFPSPPPLKPFRPDKSQESKEDGSGIVDS